MTGLMADIRNDKDSYWRTISILSLFLTFLIGSYFYSVEKVWVVVMLLVIFWFVTTYIMWRLSHLYRMMLTWFLRALDGQEAEIKDNEMASCWLIPSVIGLVWGLLIFGIYLLGRAGMTPPASEEIFVAYNPVALLVVSAYGILLQIKDLMRRKKVEAMPAIVSSIIVSVIILALALLLPSIAAFIVISL
jgi:hypothetical protein